MTKIISPQLILVDGIPCYIKDLHPCHCVITPEEDSDSTTSSDKGAESLLQDDREDSEPDSAPTEEAEVGPPSCLYEEVPDENVCCQTAIFVIFEISGECSERNHTHSKRARICLKCKMRSGGEKQAIREIELTSCRS